jgi:hypothetical protein
MKIEKGCDAFYKLALWGIFDSDVDAKDIEYIIRDSLKETIAHASTSVEGKSRIDPNPIPRVGIDFPDMSFEVSLDGQNGRDVQVNDVYINTADQSILDKYRNFSVALKNYLQTQWELFPKQYKDKPIKYNKFTTKIVFP